MSASAAKLLLELADLPQLGGRLVIETNICTIGQGNGGTTSNITASMRAVEKALGVKFPATVLQYVTWTVERASDPIGLIGDDGRQVVYAPRDGRVLKYLSKPTPRAICLGFNSDPSKQVITGTLVGKENYTPREIELFRPILHAACDAIEADSVERFAQAATASSDLNQHRVRIRYWEEIKAVATKCRALGVAASHSGTVGAVIFPPDGSGFHRLVDDAMRTFDSFGFDNLEVFQT